MKKNFVVFGLFFAIFISWVLPIFSLINNRLHPSYESALGVAYGFLIGLIIHFLMLLVWLAIRRSKLKPLELIILLVSFSFLVMLTAIGDSGSLSRMGA